MATVSLVLAGNVIFSRRLWGDTFYDLYAGRYIAHHGIPRDNVLTVASHGAPWIDQQWLAHLVYYGAWAAGGYPGLAALSAALTTSAFAVLGLLMLRRGVPGARMFAWTIGAFAACLGGMWVEAQSFAYPCFALTLWLVLEDGRAPRLRARTWLVAPVLTLWANTHGSVLLGSGLVAGYAGFRVAGSLARKDRRAAGRYLVFGAVAASAALCTPYGAGVLRYYRALIGNPLLARDAAQWQPPSVGNPLSWGFLALAVVVAAAVAAAWRRGTRPEPLLAGLALTLLALASTAVRDQAWFAFGGSLLAADTLARASGGRARALSRAFRRATAGTLGALALVSLGSLAATPVSQFQALIPSRAIDVAAAAVASHPAARVLGDDWCGTAMLWLRPATLGRVGFDARLEQYSGRELSAFFDFLAVRGPGWARATNGYDILVASRLEHPRLADALVRLPGWRVLYADSGGLVLERRPPRRAGRDVSGRLHGRASFVGRTAELGDV